MYKKQTLKHPTQENGVVCLSGCHIINFRFTTLQNCILLDKFTVWVQALQPCGTRYRKREREKSWNKEKQKSQSVGHWYLVQATLCALKMFYTSSQCHKQHSGGMRQWTSGAAVNKKKSAQTS
jgi:hypothetical protein